MPTAIERSITGTACGNHDPAIEATVAPAWVAAVEVNTRARTVPGHDAPVAPAVSETAGRNTGYQHRQPAVGSAS
ncbi:hypothetical protein GCM10010530_67240 [Kribbella aluminosa]